MELLKEFPFPEIRGPQKAFISDVQKVIDNKRHLIANAPTGLGKTAGSLFPSLRSAIENGLTVLFLTSRLSQHRMAVETLKSMRKNTSFNAVDIVGKMWLCSYDVQDMDNSLFSHFCKSRIKDKSCKYYHSLRKSGELTEGASEELRKILENGPLSSEEAKRAVSGRHCTYELLMESAKLSSAIIGDYFHIFSPKGENFLLKTKKNIDKCIIIVDEAHNLPARIRNSLSNRISTRTTELAKKECEKFGIDAKDEINAVEIALRSCAGSLLKSSEAIASRDEFIGFAEKNFSYHTLATMLKEKGEMVLKERNKSFIEKIALFLDEWPGSDEGYARIISREGEGRRAIISLNYNCMDPSLISREIITSSHSAILMSGTMKPMHMYRDLLGMEAERTDMNDYPSAFPLSNRLDVIVKGITTSYKNRTQDNYRKIAKTVALCTEAIRGNSAAFFPSYEIMKEVHSLSKDFIKKRILMEYQGTKSEKERMLEEFGASPNAALFAVLGGSFSEGIDLPGDKLNGVIIVGIPFEKPTLSTELLIKYYNKRFGQGKEYGYIYPALTKAMQAAGRVIRSETDRGVCVFADERFSWNAYRGILYDRDIPMSERPERMISEFFVRKR